MQRNNNVPRCSLQKRARLKSSQRRFSERQGACNVKGCGNHKIHLAVITRRRALLGVRRIENIALDTRRTFSISLRWFSRFCSPSTLYRARTFLLRTSVWIFAFQCKTAKRIYMAPRFLKFFYATSVAFPWFIWVRVNLTDATDRYMCVCVCVWHVAHTLTEFTLALNEYEFSRNKSLKLPLFLVFFLLTLLEFRRDSGL